MERLLYTPEQAAEALNIARSTVYVLMRMGDIPSVKIGRARRIPAVVVREYVERLLHDEVA